MFHQVHGESKFSSSTESNFLRVKVVSFVNTKTTENDRNDQFVIFVRYFKDVRYIFFRDLNDLKIFVTQISCTLSTRKVLFIFFFFYSNVSNGIFGHLVGSFSVKRAKIEERRTENDRYAWQFQICYA